MNFSKFLAASILLTTAVIGTSPVTIAQNPPAQTFQPGPWQPIARVDAKRPVGVKIINQTDLLLDYDLTANINPSPKQVTPGETTKLDSVRLPAYVLINPSLSTTEVAAHSLIYSVAVDENNVITVTVTKTDSDAPGYTTLNINRSGAIYAY